MCAIALLASHWRARGRAQAGFSSRKARARARALEEGLARRRALHLPTRKLLKQQRQQLERAVKNATASIQEAERQRAAATQQAAQKAQASHVAQPQPATSLDASSGHGRRHVARSVSFRFVSYPPSAR